MTELERRALLGDRKAQNECTEKRIILQCPACGCDDLELIGLSVWHEQYFYSCEACGCNGPIAYDSDECDYPSYKALALWNTRPATPIGRCKDCAAYMGNKCMNTGYYKPETGFCDDFEPKGGKENGRTAVD